METEWEREAEILERQLEEGTITPKEFDNFMRELERDYRSAAHEAAQGAYEQELARW